MSGYATFAEPPPDFYAVFEVYLDGRWAMFDPPGMSPLDQIVRLANGRDAKDEAFATIFGPARLLAMNPDIVLLNRNTADGAGRLKSRSILLIFYR